MTKNILNYPKTHTGTQVDNYHGTQVPIPTDGWKMSDSPETIAWVEGPE